MSDLELILVALDELRSSRDTTDLNSCTNFSITRRINNLLRALEREVRSEQNTTTKATG